MKIGRLLAVLLAGACSRPAVPVDKSTVGEDTPLYIGAKKSVGCGVTSEYGRKLYLALLSTSIIQQPRLDTDVPPAAERALLRDVPTEPKALYARYKAARAVVEKLYPEHFVKDIQTEQTMFAWNLAGEYLKPDFDQARTVCAFRLQDIDAGMIPDVAEERVTYPEMKVPGYADSRGRLIIIGGYFCGSECKWYSYNLLIVDKRPDVEHTRNWFLTQDAGWPQKVMELPGWGREE